MVHISNPSEDDNHGIPESSSSEGGRDQTDPTISTQVQRPGKGRLEVKLLPTSIQPFDPPNWKVALFSFGNRITKWVSANRTPSGFIYRVFFRQDDILSGDMVQRAILWDSNDFMEIIEMDVPVKIDPVRNSYVNFEFIRPMDVVD
jgi:hypothetical protein